VAFGIPVMGHVGLTPQSVNQFSGYSVQGKTVSSAQKILDDARAVEEAGAFAIVLECVPVELAAKITQLLSIPTIGIGSGPCCDGQIQVFHDILGVVKNFTPKHAKLYANLNKQIASALAAYKKDVEGKGFPEKKHSTSYKSNIVDKLN
jgi:3-methyl-2-oxobutanoate hydroxymethyltransferase